MFATGEKDRTLAAARQFFADHPRRRVMRVGVAVGEVPLPFMGTHLIRRAHVVEDIEAIFGDDTPASQKEVTA